MDQMKLYDISEPFMDLINPLSKDHVRLLGEVLKLREGQRIIDFGCGFGEFLAMWSEAHGITGIGIDIREYSIERALERIKGAGLADRIDLWLGDGKDYVYRKGEFDHALCIGASFIWGDYRKTIQGMRDAIKPDGRLVIGEPYWSKTPVPEEYYEEYKMIVTEIELAEITREEGFDIEYMTRASLQDWDIYEAGNWLGLSHWLDTNPGHPDRQQVIEWWHKIQDEYLRYGREYLGWAVYVLKQK